MNFDAKFPHTLTFWGNPVPDGFGGYVYAAPVALQGRWQQRQELFITRDGKEVRSQAVVYCTHTVVEGGYLHLGTSTAASPLGVSGAKEIRAVQHSPSIDGSQELKKVML